MHKICNNFKTKNKGPLPNTEEGHVHNKKFTTKIGIERVNSY